MYYTETDQVKLDIHTYNSLPASERKTQGEVRLVRIDGKWKQVEFVPRKRTRQ